MHTRILLLVLAVTGAACGGSATSGPAETTPDRGLSTVQSVRPGEVVEAGILVIRSDCTFLDVRGHSTLVLAWPDSMIGGDEDRESIAFETERGVIDLEDGDRVTLSLYQADQRDHVVGPEGCEPASAWVVTDVIEHIAEREVPAGVTEPSVPPPGETLVLECPDDAPVETTTWVGPSGLTLRGAVDEAFGDLVVGRVGEPYEVVTTDTWSVWGLEAEDGSLVAVATMLGSGGVWDPSHARYCNIPPIVEEAPPFTLYVSNQSFEHPSVRIVVTLNGLAVVDDIFDVENQHNVVTYELDLQPGRYTAHVFSDTGVSMRGEFTIEEGQPSWGAVMYWYYPEDGPPEFSFDVEEEPIGFG